MLSWLNSIFQYVWQPLSRFLQPVLRPILRIARWDGFWWTVGTLALLAIGAFALWFYLENQLLDQESLTTTIFNLILMESGVILGLIAVVRRWPGLGWIIAIYLVLIASLVVSMNYWHVLHSDQDSVSTTVRNLGLITGGIVAMLLAFWRSTVAERQADATFRQASAALLQAETAERESITTLRSFLNERYEQGCSRLGSDDPAVRLDGIDMLERLAREHPQEYHVQVSKRLSSFVRTSDVRRRAPAEIQAAIEAIGSRSEEDVRLESNESFELNLSGSNLQNLHLAHLNLSGSNLMKANLSDAFLWEVDLTNANLQGAILRDARGIIYLTPT